MRHSIAVMLVTALAACANATRSEDSPCYSAIDYVGWEVAEDDTPENMRLRALLETSRVRLSDAALESGYLPPIGREFTVYVEHSCTTTPVLSDYPSDRQSTRSISQSVYDDVLGIDRTAE